MEQGFENQHKEGEKARYEGGENKNDALKKCSLSAAPDKFLKDAKIVPPLTNMGLSNSNFSNG